MISVGFCKKKTKVWFWREFGVFSIIYERRKNKESCQNFYFYTRRSPTQDPINNRKVLRNAGKLFQKNAPAPYTKKRISTSARHFKNKTWNEERPIFVNKILLQQRSEIVHSIQTTPHIPQKSTASTNSQNKGNITIQCTIVKTNNLNEKRVG